MTKATEIRKGRHCVFLMHAHLVFVTKYRKAAFRPQSCKGPNCDIGLRI